MSPHDPSGPPRGDIEAELRERIKELDFLHHAARLLNMRGEPRDILAAVLELLPDAWRYPDLASARLVFGDIDLSTAGYEQSPWSLRSEFQVAEGVPVRGFVEVVYREAPRDGGDPFMTEERVLLDSCAELLKAYFERMSSEAARAELARAEAAERAARAASSAKDEFLGTVAHELRSSLHVMRGWIQILKQGPKDDQVAARGLTILERNVSLQAKLIEDLLDLSRITSGKLRLDLRWLDLMELVAYAVDATRPAAEAKQITLTHDLEPVGDVCADQQRLQQVVYNLLGNAVKFTPEGGAVTVTLRKAGSHAELAVKDNGPGIDPELLPHIFERFKQAGVPAGRRGGLGLGLAIAHHLVEGHHGTITAESEGKGKGATFRILLPLRGS